MRFLTMLSVVTLSLSLSILSFPQHPILPQFARGKEFGNSTSREAFQQYSANSYKPDASTRRKGLLRNDVTFPLSPVALLTPVLLFLAIPEINPLPNLHHTPKCYPVAVSLHRV